MSSLSLSNPAFQSYLLYSGILAVKILVVVMLTIISKVRSKAPADFEGKGSNGKGKYEDPDLERIRRAHLNDLENIPMFWMLAAIYLTTEPSVAWAKLLFRCYTVGRIMHTLVFAVVPLPQPSRAIFFLFTFFILWYMSIQVVIHYAFAL